MKKLLLTLSCYLVAFISTAQSFKLTWGPVLEDPKSSFITGIIGTDSKNFYAVRQKMSILKYTVFLESYNSKTLSINYSKDMQEELISRIKDLPISNPDPKSVGVKDVVMIKGKMYILVIYYDKKDSNASLFASEVNPQTGKVGAKFQKLLDFEVNSKLPGVDIKYKLSADSTSFLTYIKVDKGKKESDFFKAKLFDLDLKEIWSKNFELEKSENTVIKFHDFYADTKGNFHVLSSFIWRKNRGDADAPNYNHKIISYFPAKDSILTYELNVQDKLITDLEFRLSKDNKLICAGFYLEKAKSSNSRSSRYSFDYGIVYLSIDGNTGTLIKAKTEDFSKLADQFIDYSEDRKRATTSRNYIKDLIINDDGSINLFAEQFYSIEITPPREALKADGSNLGSQRVNPQKEFVNYFLEILASKISASGEVEWIKIIPKNQKIRTFYDLNDPNSDRADLTYASFSVFKQKENYCIFFNDNPKNEMVDGLKEKLKEMNDPDNSMTMLVVIDSTGKWSKAPMFKNKDLKTICSPSKSSQISPNEVLLFGADKRIYQFGKVTF